MQHVGATTVKLGIGVFIALFVLKGIEYVISVSMHIGAAPLVLLIGVLSAWLVLRYFMHINQLWHGDES